MRSGPARLERSARWFLDSEAERRARARPAAREVAGRRAVEGLAQPFAVTAKADRLDLTADGAFAIYDYKSGDAPSGRKARLLSPAPSRGGDRRGRRLRGPASGSHRASRGARHQRPQGRAARLLARLSRRTSGSASAASSPGTRTRATPYVARLRPGQLKYPGDYEHLARFGEWSDGDDPDGGDDW